MASSPSPSLPGLGSLTPPTDPSPRPVLLPLLRALSPWTEPSLRLLPPSTGQDARLLSLGSFSSHSQPAVRQPRRTRVTPPRIHISSPHLSRPRDPDLGFPASTRDKPVTRSPAGSSRLLPPRFPGSRQSLTAHARVTPGPPCPSRGEPSQPPCRNSSPPSPPSRSPRPVGPRVPGGRTAASFPPPPSLCVLPAASGLRLGKVTVPNTPTSACGPGAETPSSVRGFKVKSQVPRGLCQPPPPGVALASSRAHVSAHCPRVAPRTPQPA